MLCLIDNEAPTVRIDPMHSPLSAALAVVLVTISGSSLRAADPDRYLCISEYGAGVQYSPATKTWGPTIFGGGRKYILRQLKGEEREAKYPSDTSPDGYTIWDHQPKDKSDWGFLSLARSSRVRLATLDLAAQMATQPRSGSRRVSGAAIAINTGIPPALSSSAFRRRGKIHRYDT